MGLDMYLTKKTYVKNYDSGDNKYEVTVKKDGKILDHVQPVRIAYVEEEIGYWRKANAIHKWFVENVQDGEDDCGNYYVSTEKLEGLLNDVDTVLNASRLVKGKIVNGQHMVDEVMVDKLIDGEYVEDSTVASTILPTESGFFFGGTAYDQYYIRDLENTKKIIEVAIKESNDADIYYHSSW